MEATGPTDKLADHLKEYVLDGYEPSKEFTIWASNVQDLTSLADCSDNLEKLWRVTVSPYHPVFLASRFGFTWILNEFFQYDKFGKFNINLQNDTQDDGLCLAARFGHMSVVEALLKQGANINYRGSEGKTPLSHAIILRHSNIAKLTLGGADRMNHCDKLFHTALHDAAQVDLDDIAPLLLQHGADINQWGFERWSPLMWAALHGSKKVARVLLDWNGVVHADIRFESKLGRTVVAFADEGVIEVLLDHIANIQDPLLQDIITTAVNDDRIGVVRLLINRGLDLNMTDRYGQSPLDYALQYSKTDALDILIAHDVSPVLKCDPQSRYI